MTTPARSTPNSSPNARNEPARPQESKSRSGLSTSSTAFNPFDLTLVISELMPIWAIPRGTFASEISEGWRAIRKPKSTDPNPENWGASCQMREAVTGIIWSRRKSFSARAASSRNAPSGIRSIHPARNRQVGSESSNQDPLNVRVLASTHFRSAALDRETRCLICVTSLERSSTLSCPGSLYSKRRK